MSKGGVKSRRLCAPRKVALLTDELLCPYNGGTAQKVIAARWKVVADPKTIDKWVKSGLFVGKRRLGRRTLQIRVRYPLAHWRGFVVTSRQALEAWMDRCEQEQGLCKAWSKDRILRGTGISVEVALASGDVKSEIFRRALAVVRASPDGRNGVNPGGLVDILFEHIQKDALDRILDAVGPRLAGYFRRKHGLVDAGAAEDEVRQFKGFFWGADESDPLMAAFEQLGEPGDGDAGSAAG